MTTHTVLNPATAEPFAEVSHADGAATDAAIERAHEAFGGWRAVAPGDRARLLRRFAEEVVPVVKAEVKTDLWSAADARRAAGFTAA